MFTFKSAAHFLASAVHDTKVWLAGHQAQIDGTLRAGAIAISVADPALAPLALAIDRAAEAALGSVLAAVSAGDATVQATSAAGSAQGLNIQLDVAAIEEFKKL